jgi:TPP-dependent pyruvate/acetoin dehydrogenase alpha subunit
LEEVAEGRLDPLMAKEDCITELDRVTTAKLELFREECEVEEQEVCDRVDQKANIVYDTMSEKIEAYVDTKMDHLERERGWLGWGGRSLRGRRGV